MYLEEISFTQNQKGNDNLTDSSGFAYQEQDDTCEGLHLLDLCYTDKVPLPCSNCHHRLHLAAGLHPQQPIVGEDYQGHPEEPHEDGCFFNRGQHIILEEITTEIENRQSSATAFIAPKQNVSKAIQREKDQLKGFPPKPKNFDDLLSIADKLSVFSDGQSLLIFNKLVIPEDPPPPPHPNQRGS
jgi:hypothetical protein